MDKVRMFHPGLPGQPEIDVLELAVAHRRKSGWLLVSERQPEKKPPPPNTEPAEPAAPAVKPTPSSRPKPDGSSEN